jgi:hypothetical protein
MVFSKSGGAGFSAIFWISARFCRMAASIAGAKCATRTSLNGGTPPCGPTQSCNSGFSGAAAASSRSGDRAVGSPEGQESGAELTAGGWRWIRASTVAPEMSSFW